MTKREKILIAVTTVATGVSICMFAFVSLAHFLKTAQNVTIPMASRLYENTVDQLATIEPVDMPVQMQPNASTPADDAKPEVADTTQRSKSYAVSSKTRYPKLDEVISNPSKKPDLDIKIDPSVVHEVLTEIGVDPRTIDVLQLKRLL